MIVKVSFELNFFTPTPTPQQMRDWVGFELGKYADLAHSNPLCNQDLECRSPIRIEIDGKAVTI